jgi:hypothetical protein
MVFAIAIALGLTGSIVAVAAIAGSQPAVAGCTQRC